MSDGRLPPDLMRMIVDNNRAGLGLPPQDHGRAYVAEALLLLDNAMERLRMATMDNPTAAMEAIGQARAHLVLWRARHPPKES